MAEWVTGHSVGQVSSLRAMPSRQLLLERMPNETLAGSSTLLLRTKDGEENFRYDQVKGSS